jgi:hypothetical protein
MDTIITIFVKRDGAEPANEVINDIGLVLDERFGMEVSRACLNRKEENLHYTFFTTDEWTETRKHFKTISKEG